MLFLETLCIILDSYHCRKYLKQSGTTHIGQNPAKDQRKIRENGRNPTLSRCASGASPNMSRCEPNALVNPDTWSWPRLSLLISLQTIVTWFAIRLIRIRVCNSKFESQSNSKSKLLFLLHRDHTRDHRKSCSTFFSPSSPRGPWTNCSELHFLKTLNPS